MAYQSVSFPIFAESILAIKPKDNGEAKHGEGLCFDWIEAAALNKRRDAARLTTVTEEDARRRDISINQLSRDIFTTFSTNKNVTPSMNECRCA